MPLRLPDIIIVTKILYMTLILFILYIIMLIFASIYTSLVVKVNGMLLKKIIATN